MQPRQLDPLFSGRYTARAAFATMVMEMSFTVMYVEYYRVRWV